jgi:hypothetical protein
MHKPKPFSSRYDAFEFFEKMLLPYLELSGTSDDTNLSIYGIREVIQRDTDYHIRGNRKLQRWTLRFKGEDNKYNKILFRKQDGRFFLYLTPEVANETKMERVLVDTGATASILSKDYIRHIKTDTKSEALMYDGT